MQGQYAPVSKQEQDMSESLVGNPSSVATASAMPMMEVTAPANLPEGYEFDAMLGDSTIKVQVPVGGIEEGQIFSVPMPATASSMINAIQIPVGEWRDSLWSLFRHGVCHPHVWTSCCCTTGMYV